MQTLTQKHFKYLAKPFQWITVDKNGDAWAHTHDPLYSKGNGTWGPKPENVGIAQMDWVGPNFTFGQVLHRERGWMHRLFVAWLDQPPMFTDADRYRFSRDCLFNNELWAVWSAIRFAKRYDFDAAKYDECVDEAMSAAIEKGIWK